eukprot:994793-Amphidinium_carterae.1
MTNCSVALQCQRVVNNWTKKKQLADDSNRLLDGVIMIIASTGGAPVLPSKVRQGGMLWSEQTSRRSGMDSERAKLIVGKLSKNGQLRFLLVQKEGAEAGDSSEGHCDALTWQ